MCSDTLSGCCFKAEPASSGIVVEAARVALALLGQDVVILYNVACLAALANSEADCRLHLEVSVQHCKLSYLHAC